MACDGVRAFKWQEMHTDAREEACRWFTSRNWSYFCRSHHFDRRLQCTHFGLFVNISKHANRALLLVVNIITIRTLVGLSGNFVMHILATNTSKNKIKYVDENLFFSVRKNSSRCIFLSDWSPENPVGTTSRLKKRNLHWRSFWNGLMRFYQCQAWLLSLRVSSSTSRDFQFVQFNPEDVSLISLQLPPCTPVVCA